MSRLVLDKLAKCFRGPKDEEVWALREVSFEVQDNELLVLVGPSGSGKSTLLRLVAGLDCPTSGTIWIKGRDANNLEPQDRDVAMVFQNHALFPHMTVYGNMALGLKLRRFPRDEIDKRVREAAELLGLEAFLDRLPGALSGGERQRVAVGRAIVRRPEVFLLDEPLSNLDAGLRARMRVELARLQDRIGATMLYVTHDQVEAMTLGDRIVVLKDGVVQQVASPAALYQEPSNQFVATFIGSPPMNLIEGFLDLEGDLLFFSRRPRGQPAGGPDCRVRIAEPHATRLRRMAGAPITLGLRPEHVIQSSLAEIAHAQESVEAIVEMVEPLGAETYLHVRCAAGALVARADRSCNATRGRAIWMRLDTANAHFFEPGTGKAVRE